MSTPKRRATADELRAAFGTDGRAEIIHGEIVQKALPKLAHSEAETGILSALRRRFHRATGGKWPGGWWLLSEVHVGYETHEVYCHDGVGWRREVHAELPKDDWPLVVRPDWVLEVLSPGHKRRDRFDKWRVLHRAGVPHYWLADHENNTLEVYRWHPDGFLNVIVASTGEVVRAEPFEAIELRVSVLFGAEDDDE